MDRWTDLLKLLQEADEAELRRRWFNLPADAPEPGRAYPYQMQALERIEAGLRKDRLVSGILHYPTGAGKTRVALEVMARALRSSKDQRFIWATRDAELIRQSMVRLVELSSAFPKAIRFTWCESAEELDLEPEEPIHIKFMTRDTLQHVFERASDTRRTRHAWRILLEAGMPITLVYDECHELGSEDLQRSWQRFYETVVSPPLSRQLRPFRTIGLGATPLPSRVEAHRFLGECVFPRTADVPSTSHDWPVHVFHRVTNDALVKSGVLCPVNKYFDDRGVFDIPAATLRRVIGAAGLEPPGPDASPGDVRRYADKFNQVVMGARPIVQFLAD